MEDAGRERLGLFFRFELDLGFPSVRGFCQLLGCSENGRRFQLWAGEYDALSSGVRGGFVFLT
jgi:hypothetical protein